MLIIGYRFDRRSRIDAVLLRSNSKATRTTMPNGWMTRMRCKDRHSFTRRGHAGAAIALAFVVAALVTFCFTPQANALPSFARQTGQPCGTCHTDFPGLTPFGRRFKLLGYTTGGGLYRTNPFSSGAGGSEAELRAYASQQRVDGNGPVVPVGSGERGWVPPVSAMVITGYTHTQVAAAPPTDPYKPNDNVVVSPISFFWGGAITSNIGAFGQVTYNAPGPTAGNDPFLHLDLGQYRRPLRQYRADRSARFDLRNHRQQQSNGSGPLEYDAGLGLSVRRARGAGRQYGPLRRHDARRRICRARRRRRRLHHDQRPALP